MRYLYLVLAISFFGCNRLVYHTNGGGAIPLCNMKSLEKYFPQAVIDQRVAKVLPVNVKQTCEYHDMLSSGRVYCFINRDCALSFVVNPTNSIFSTTKLHSDVCVEGTITSVDIIYTWFLYVEDITSTKAGKCGRE